LRLTKMRTFMGGPFGRSLVDDVHTGFARAYDERGQREQGPRRYSKVPMFALVKHVEVFGG